MEPGADEWTFVELGGPRDTNGSATASTASTTASAVTVPLWAIVAMGVIGVCAVTGTGLIVAVATGVFKQTTARQSPSPPSSPAPPPPYTSDDATSECNNDCVGCGVNGGCTYSYGNGGASPDSRTYQSDGVCDDGGPGSEHSYCDLGTFFTLEPWSPHASPSLSKQSPVPNRRQRLCGLW